MGIIALNDTGSDFLTLVNTDLPHLGNVIGYRGWLHWTSVIDASGNTSLYRKITVQVQLVGDVS